MNLALRSLVLVALTSLGLSFSPASMADDCYNLVKTIKQNKTKRVERAVSRGTNLNCLPQGRNANKKWGDETPLTAALTPFKAGRELNRDIIQLLLEGGADPNFPKSSGISPLGYLLSNKFSVTFDDMHYGTDLLLEAGADPNADWEVMPKPAFEANAAGAMTVTISGMFADDGGIEMDVQSIHDFALYDLRIFSSLVEAGLDVSYENPNGESIGNTLQKMIDQAPQHQPFQQMKQLYDETLNAIETERRAAEYAETQRLRKAQLESLLAGVNEKITTQIEKDRRLPADIRMDKYLVALNQQLRQENFVDAVVYYELLEGMNAPLEPAVLYYKGETFFNLDMYDRAIQAFHQYVLENSSEAPQYVASLEYALRALAAKKAWTQDETPLQDMIARSDRVLPAEIRYNKYTVGLSSSLQARNFNEALTYLELLDGTGIEASPSLIFYHGQALIELGQKQEGIEKLYDYLGKAGRDGEHYATALSLISANE